MKFRTLKPLTILSTLLIIILCFTASASAFFVSSEKTHVGKKFFSNAFFTRNFSPLTVENTPVKNYDDKKNASDSLLATERSIWNATKNKTSAQNAFKHWTKHGSEFPQFQNAKQYVEGAMDFVTNPPNGTLSATMKDGGRMFYNPTTNTFAMSNSAGSPMSMFKPNPATHGLKTNMDYWLQELAKWGAK